MQDFILIVWCSGKIPDALDQFFADLEEICPGVHIRESEASGPALFCGVVGCPLSYEWLNGFLQKQEYFGIDGIVVIKD